MCKFSLTTLNSIPIHLESGYTAEFDTVNEYEWHKIVEQFSDANIFQTWAYDAIRCGEENISHLVLRFNGKVIAAAQARIVRIPVISMGAAYVRWGPLWQLRNQNTDHKAFRMAVRALRNEYVCRRGLILRLFPVLYDDNSNLCFENLTEEGYVRIPENRGRTIIVDILPPMEELRKNLHQKWRNCLNKAERNQLEIIEGYDDSLFADFIGIYRELLQRKKFQEPNDINEFRMIQQELPDEFKMGIFISRSDGHNSSGAILTAIGNTGVYLFGATNDEGMKNNGSYLLQWRAIQWMKNNGCRYYNLYGINPLTNPGSYHFKSRLAGKSGKDVHYLGRFDCYSGVISAKIAQTADFVLPFMKKIFNRIR